MSAMSIQSEPSRTKGLLPSLADTDACNSHMGSRLWIAHIVHMTSTVLLVDTRPVKTDNKTRAGVHNNVSNPSVTQQSDRPGGWKEAKSSVSLPKRMEFGQRNANSNTCTVEDRTKEWTILDIPTTDKRTCTKVQPGPREQNYPTQNENCAYNMKTPLEMIPKLSPKAPWRTTRNTKTRSTNWCPKTIQNLAVRSPR